MVSPVEEIASVAMQLPREQRAYLAERLLASLDDDAEVEQAWAAEIRRRVAELQSGQARELDGEQVFDELKDLYR